MFKLIQYLSAYAKVHDFRNDKNGASLAEYALLLGLIVSAVAFTVTLLSGTMGDVFTAITAAISADGGGTEEG